MDNLCKLINRPRTKKEAKVYYRIDQASYESAVDNGEVSETEIQNILNHFKKLGKNTDRYTDSFNNIAAQYTDDQLRLIINVLPIKVKAVLEAESDKYQSLMGTSSDERRTVVPVESGIRVNTIGSGREKNINGPIVIPSGVKKFTGGARPIVPNNTASRPQSRPVTPTSNQLQSQKVTQQQVQISKTVIQESPKVQQTPQARPQVQQSKVQINPIQSTPQSGGNVIPKNMVQRANPVAQDPIVNKQIATVEPVASTVNSHDDSKRYTGTISQVKRTLIARRKVNTVPVQPVVEQVAPVEAVIPEVENEEEVFAEEPRRGRGRPRKIVPEEELNKPKGKRGRPRKNPIEEESNLDDLLGGLGNNSDDEIMIPGLEDEEDVLPGLSEETVEEVVLPGIEDDTEDVLPGLDDENSVETEVMIPGLEDEEDNGILPGLDDTEDEEGEEVDVNSLLAGLEDDNNEDNPLPNLEDEEDILPGLSEELVEESSLPGLDDAELEETDGVMIPGLEDEETDGMLPGMDDTESEETDEVMIPGLEDEEDDGMLPGLDNNTNDFVAIPGLDDTNDDILPGIEEPENDEETILPGMGFEDEEDQFTANNSSTTSNAIESIKPQIDYSMSNLNSLLSKDKKIVSFVGATKNGTSFLINNLALMFSMMGIDVAILDMTQNKNSYYLFTDSREELRKIAYTSLSKLENGYADGIKFNKNLTVYTGLPSDGAVYENAEPILSTLVQNHSLVLIDTDFTTPPAYFASSQEIYLVQSMDILTIQPLTAFLRDLKFKGAWEPEKARVVINKEVPIRILSSKTIIGGMSRYNGPDMSVMTDLFNKDMVKACSIPFDEKVYAKYLETLATCKLSISSLPKQFRAKLQILGEMVYPRLNSKTSYSPSPDMGGATYNPNGNAFSSDTNNILNKMKKKF